MLKVLLISVGIDNKYGLVSGKANQNRIITPMLSIPYIAAMISTLNDVELQVIDEAHEIVNDSMEADIVGLSGMTMHANRMYHLADQYRERGTYVVLGGIHVSFMQEEALKHADTVMIGEGEYLWLQFLEDYQRHKPQKVYRCTTLVDITKLPRPRLDLVKGPAYSGKMGSMNAIMASRGCPNNCSFCCVKNMFGRIMRYRDVDDVCNEIRDMNNDLILFADDNMIGNPNYAKNLFEKMIPLNRIWGGQMSITLGSDSEMLELAAKAGLRSVFIGIESVDKKNIANMNKSRVNHVDEYSELLHNIRSYGIEIFGSFIVGLDEDTEETFNDLYEFIVKKNINYPCVGILTPFPGTKLYFDMIDSDRIIDFNWDKYNLTHVVYKPNHLSVEQLQYNYDELMYEIGKLRLRGERF